MNPTACIRCRGTDLAAATLEGEGVRVVVDASHHSPVAARVCLACGAVMLTATEPGNLRLGGTRERDVQEYDF